MAKDITSFGSLFHKMLNAYGLLDAYRAQYVKHKWQDIVGEALAKRTHVRAVQKKTLYLQVFSGPLRYTLKNKKQELLTLIEEKVGKNVVVRIIYQ